jgi:hypothetical protein
MNKKTFSWKQLLLTLTIAVAGLGFTGSVAKAMDPVAVAFDTVSATLVSNGIANNLDTVDSTNYTSFAGLYFEKRTDVADPTTAMGRITFDSALDLSNTETQTFLQNLGTKLDASTIGTIGLDFTGVTDSVALKGTQATIKFYGLDKMGFTASSTAAEINAQLKAFDDDGNPLDKSSLIPSDGTYLGACEVGGGCYVFTVGVNHFTKYKIDDGNDSTDNNDNHHGKNWRSYKQYKNDYTSTTDKKNYAQIKKLRKTNRAEFERLKTLYAKYKGFSNQELMKLSLKIQNDYKLYKNYRGHRLYLFYKNKVK